MVVVLVVDAEESRCCGKRRKASQTRNKTGYIVPGRCLGPQAINQQINRIKVEDCIATLRRELLVFYLLEYLLL